MKSFNLVDSNTSFINDLAQIDHVVDIAKMAVNFLKPLLKASDGHLYLQCAITQNIKLIYQTSAQKPQGMHAPKSFEILLENDQAIIPLMLDNVLMGSIVFQGVTEADILKSIDTIKSTLPFFNLKIKGLVERELLETKIRIINERQLSYELSEQGDVIQISSALANTLGYEAHELLGKKPDFFNNANESIANAKEIQIIKKDGENVWVKTETVPTQDILGEHSGGYICFQQNISREKLIEEMALRDELTNLYNRRFFNQIFSKLIDSAKRNNNYLILMVIDIDNFKKYNDTYGHHEGDKALALTAKTIVQSFKRKGDYVFRLGGEEFGVLCNVTQPEDAEVLANFCRQSIQDLQIPHTGSIEHKVVTISTGLVIINNSNLLDADEIYKTADVALYEAKSCGRNCVKVAGQVDDIELF